MSDASRNWDFSRLAYMDIVIMQIAIAEIMTFPNIPINVTINEYVELAKLYSTRKSGGYINGMLDTIARHLIDTGKLSKYIEPKVEKASKAPKAPKEPNEQMAEEPAAEKPVRATPRKRIVKKQADGEAPKKEQ